MKKYTQKGTYTIFWVISLPLMLAFGAFAIDLNNLHLAQTELQAAADSGALQGARFLYDSSGKIRNTTTIEAEVKNAVISSNQKVGSTVDPNTEISVEIGHWKFAPSGASVDAKGIERGGFFNAWDKDINSISKLINPSTNAFYSFLEINNLDGLDGRKIDLNAVKVTVFRKKNKVASFFHNFLNRQWGFEAEATSVAYIGFAGTTNPTGPFAICLDSIFDKSSSKFSCSQGFRFGNGSNNSSEIQSKGDIVWTDQVSPCTNGGPSKTSIEDKVLEKMPQCNPGSSIGIEHSYGNNLNVMLNAVVNANFDYVYNCWWNDPKAYSTGRSPSSDGLGPDKFWPLTLPVIDCKNSTSTCASIVTSVSVNVIWMVTNNQTDNKMGDTGNTPTQMESWSGNRSELNGTDKKDTAMNRWDDFADYFKVRAADGSIAECGDRQSGNNCDGYEQKTIYLANECNEVIAGNTGGAQVTGVRAAEPVLVY